MFWLSLPAVPKYVEQRVLGSYLLCSNDHSSSSLRLSAAAHSQHCATYYRQP